MTDNPSRRQVLRGVSSAGALAVFGTAGASAAGDPSLRVVEAGIRYDVPDRDDLERYHVDSRPQYTVRANQNELQLTSRASEELASKLDGGAFVDEQSAGTGASTEIHGSNREVRELPTALSARMRVMEQITLESPIRLPTVTVHANANGAAATVESKGRIDLETGSRTTVELDPVSVSAKTAVTTDEVVPLEGVPEHLWGPTEEVGTAEIQATPVVELVDHGELTVTRRDPGTPTKN